MLSRCNIARMQLSAPGQPQPRRLDRYLCLLCNEAPSAYHSAHDLNSANQDRMMFTSRTPTVRLTSTHTARPTALRPVRPFTPCRAHNKDEYKDNPLYAKEAASAAGKGASKGAEAVKDALVDTGDRLKEAAAETGAAIKHGAQAAAHNVKEGVEEAQGPRTDSGVHDTWESTQDAAKGTAKDIKKTAEGLGDRISGH